MMSGAQPESPNQGAATNHRPAGQSDRADDLEAIVADDRTFPAALAELRSLGRMKEIRVITSIAVAIVAMMALLYVFMTVETATDPYPLQKSLEIEADFNRAAAFVDKHIAQKGRMPTMDEYRAEGFDSMRARRRISLTLPPYPSELTQKYGQPPEDGYVLWCWRGEWAETYVSWTRQSSLVFDESHYMFGNAMAQAVLGVAIAVFTGFFAFKLRPWR